MLKFIRRPSIRRVLHYGLFLFMFVMSWSLFPSRSSKVKYLWITPRTGGFNNQMITIYEAIRCAKLYQRTVVLPLIYENVRADTSSKGEGPYPFEDYFDLNGFAGIVDIVAPPFFNTENPPCNTIHYWTSSHFKATGNRIPRLIKQQYTKKLPLNKQFMEKHNRPQRLTCVDDSFCEKQEWQVFGAYSQYNETGQGYNIRKSPELLHIRAAFKPSKVVQQLANFILKSINIPFNSMHVRRGDFSTKCNEIPKICDHFGSDAFVQSQEAIFTAISNFANPSLPVFISTTHSDECRELLKDANVKLIYFDDFKLPEHLLWTLHRTDILSFASQIVSSHAQDFIGNRFSSYTTEINNMRYLRNRKDQISFF